MHYSNEYVDTSSLDLPSAGFSFGRGLIAVESMSRKIFKKVVFLLMFGAAVLGMYTFVSGINEGGDKRSGEWDGLVNNMYIGDQGQKVAVNQQKVHGNRPAPDGSNGMPRFGDLVAITDKQQDDDLDDDRHFGRLEIPIDVENDPIHNDIGANEREERPIELPEPKAKPGDINIKDRSGNVIGQKLFAFGMSKNDIELHKDHIRRKDSDIAVENNDNVVENNDNVVEIDDNVVGNNDIVEDSDMREDSIAVDQEDKFLEASVDENEGENEGENEENEISQVEEIAEEEENMNEKPYYQGDGLEQENRPNENNNKPDVAIRDHQGQVIGHKLYPFGMRPGDNARQDEFSSRKLQREVPHEEPLTGRQLRNIRPDAAFFDDNGKIKEGDAELDKFSDFQERMGLNNPLLKHKFNPNDPFKKHRAMFRPLGAHGVNPALDNNDDDDGDKDPNDAFAGLDRNSVWGNRDDEFFDIKQQPQRQAVTQKPINNAPHPNLLDRGFGMARGEQVRRPMPSVPQNQFLNQNNAERQRGQFMGYDNGQGSNQYGNVNNGMPNRNFPNRNSLNDDRLMGASTKRQFSNQRFVDNNGQLMGYNNRQNQFGGQNNGAWNDPNRQQNQQQPIGLNNNDNNYNNRYPVNNNNPNRLQNNNPYGNQIQNGRNNLQNQNPNNGFGQQPQRLLGANPLNRNVGQPVSNQMYQPLRQQAQRGGQLAGRLGGVGGGLLGALPSRAPYQNPNQRLLGAITPSQRHYEQQIVNPINPINNIDNDNRPLPRVNENVQVQNTDEKEEELYIEDLTQSLAMNARCILFPFPTGEASLCVPKMAETDDQGIKIKLKEIGTWEPESLKQFDEILTMDPDIGVIDIGAGVGVYTLAAALKGRSVVAVEPLFINYRLLHKSALANNIATQIVMVAQALDKESYLGHMSYSRVAGEFNKVKIEHLAEEDVSKDPANNVHVTTLNQLVKAIPFKKALLKIDVGGVMEGDILNAGSKFFNSIDIPYILTHWNNDLELNKKIQIATKMANLQYKPKRHWDGPYLDPNSLHFSMDFLIWHKG